MTGYTLVTEMLHTALFFRRTFTLLGSRRTPIRRRAYAGYLKYPAALLRGSLLLFVGIIALRRGAAKKEVTDAEGNDG